MRNFFKVVFSIFFLVSLTPCVKPEKRINHQNFKSIPEREIKEIKLTGNSASKRNEFSGLSWWRNKLVLLPQYVFNKNNIASGKFYLIDKARILNYLNGKDTLAIKPQSVKVKTDGLEEFGRYGSGCEAIAFDDDTCYLSVEINDYSSTNAILIKGYFNGTKFVFNPATEIQVKSQTGIPNISEEALSLTPENVFTIHEANGKNVNKNPMSHFYGRKLNFISEIPMPHIEYRITDATYLDTADNFWVINYFFPGDAHDLKPANDEIAKKFGLGKTHLKAKRVERLLELHFSKKKITLVNRSPLYLKLNLKEDARNWEGIAKLDDKGFLLITDTYPRTIFGFVSF